MAPFPRYSGGNNIAPIYSPVNNLFNYFKRLLYTYYDINISLNQFY